MNKARFEFSAALAAILFFVFAARADFEIYLMRHGETSWNRAKVLQGGISFTDLTDVGVRMAEASAAELRRRGISFDAVYSSPFRRTRHTAAIIAATQGLDVRDDLRLGERRCGSCEGKRYDTSEKLAGMLSSADDVESIASIGDRALDFLREELAPLDGKVRRILCVSHSLLLSAVEARLRDEKDAKKGLLPNCCVHVLEYADGKFTLIERAKTFYDAAAFRDESKIRCVAHRGAHDLTMPEASRPAYADAAAKGSDIVKLDLQRTKDGVIVMGHDPTLRRNMGWEVKIADLSYSEIYEKGRFIGWDERIVRLDEALDLVRTVPEFWLDFKYFDEDFAERVLEIFAGKKIDPSRLMIATFNRKALAYFRDRHPEIRRVGHIGIKSSDELAAVKKYAAEYGLWGVNMPVLNGETTPKAVSELKNEGLWVSLWFVQNPAVAAKYRNSGCDAFVTDYADCLKR